MDVPRLILTAHDGTALGDLDPSEVVGLVFVSEINGENYLSLTTTRAMTKGERILYRDGMGAWHEYVVEGAEEDGTGGGVQGVYYCPWSIQYDLAGTFVSAMPGTGGTPATALQALTAALGGTARWTAGTVDVATTGSASMFRMSGWEALQVVVKTWGGEIEPVITVSTDGVAARSVNLLNHVGANTATRRFDYGADVAGIRRTVADDHWTARVIPLGKAQETDSGGYGRKVTIEAANGGVMYLEDADAVPLTRVPDGNGGWEVPTQIVENDAMETAADLKAWAQANLEEWTRPKVTYEVDAVQLEGAGAGAHGAALGDACAVVDRDFGGSPLRLTTRLLRIEENVLDRSQSVLTFTNLIGGLGSQLADIARSVAEVQSQVTNMSLTQSTADYISALLARINTEANATGGYTYITEGQGLRCYDVAVTDPLVGAEASQVIELKGGLWRIANTRDGGGNWEWRTVGTGAGIIADSITSGTIDASVVSIANLLMIGTAAGANVQVVNGGVEFSLPYDDGNGNAGTISATIYPSVDEYAEHGGLITRMRPTFHLEHGSAKIRMVDNGRVFIDTEVETGDLIATDEVRAQNEIYVGGNWDPYYQQLLFASEVSLTPGAAEIKSQSTPHVSVSTYNPYHAASLQVSGDKRGVYDGGAGEWIAYADDTHGGVVNGVSIAAGINGTQNRFDLINPSTNAGVRLIFNTSTLNLAAQYTTDGGSTWSAVKTLASWA